MGDYKQLEVWQLAHVLTLSVYRVTRGFPKDELYGLGSQLRRAAASVESNIAEGCGRRGDPENRRFLRYARGSVTEVECQLLLARDLGYLDRETWGKLDDEAQRVSRMLIGLMRALRGGSATRP